MYDTPRQSPPLFTVEDTVYSGTCKTNYTLDFVFQFAAAATCKSPTCVVAVATMHAPLSCMLARGHGDCGCQRKEKNKKEKEKRKRKNKE
jgi:hypothetical protein